MQKKEILFIVMPAYNEAQNIEKVIKDWYPIIEEHNANGQSRMVVIDDGSKDETFSILQKLEKEHPYLVAMTKENEGHGATLWTGYNYALENGAEYIFQTDSDGQTSPSEFDMFWHNKENYNMVIGYRNNREDGGTRIFVTKVLKWVLYFVFGIKITDANTPYRLMDAESLKYGVERIPKKHFLTNVLLSVVYHKKWKIKYIPISFRNRQGGVNSVNLVKIIKIGFSALKDFKDFKREINK